ncbi:unnamed protein product [Angiostrongylus costaricensis]|uniref:General transcription factor IIH subunit 3 n=1 Tax=Angiostrongylus costaricensis TaxID=334426 RepID=A0A0R3PKY8_ANGCS|nr:unnamed protein product [Angiostrongylus costaricensis]
MSTLALLVEGSACAWGRLALAHGSPLMNLFFYAAKHGICVDVVSLVETSPLLQQATDITSGIFLQVGRPCKLLSNHRHIDVQEVDYRASCACHHELVSSGWVCSVCLSVLCQFMPICKFSFSTNHKKSRALRVDQSLGVAPYIRHH